MSEQIAPGLEDLPPDAQRFATMDNRPRNARIEDVLPGEHWKQVRNDLRSAGIASYRTDAGDERYLVADFNKDGHLMALAAAVPRNPGKSLDYLNSIEDFAEAINATQQSRTAAIALYHRVARAEGVVSNSINKLAALVASDGKFKVRGVKGVKGKSGDKNAAEAQEILNWWKDNVNARPLDSVITGERGIKSFILQGARLNFIEGDHIARHVWGSAAVKIPGMSKAVTLPMNLQTFSAQHIEIPEGLEGTNIELLYWKPPKKFIDAIKNPKDPNVKRVLTQLLGSKVIAALNKDGKYLLDPSLMLHIKHRGLGIEPFGQSLIEPALADIRYKRALDALEIVTISNLINRLVILKVGDANENSDYHKAEINGARLGLLQRIMRNVGPSSTILWAGHDITVEQVSAHDGVLDLNDRFRIAERRILMALGVPAVLLIGEGGDGKAVANAAALALTAQLKEIQEQYAQALRSLAEVILTENGYEEIDVIWEWSDDLLDNKEAAAEMLLKLFQIGFADTRTMAEGLGWDHDALRIRQDEDVSNGYREKPFGAPNGAVTTNAAGIAGGGGGAGRPPTSQTGNKDPRAGKETGSPEPNK